MHLLKTKLRHIHVSDLDALALGANVLGSGGGGDPAYDLLIAKEQIETYGPAPICSVQDLADDSLVMPIGYMGAPLVSLELLPSMEEFPQLIAMVEKYFDCSVQAIIPFEVGGSNLFAPFAVASQLQLPIVDGDTMGRAFPQMHMSYCNLASISCSPAFIVDSVGSGAIVKAKTPIEMERYLRALTASMGASTAVCTFPMTGTQAQKAIISGTLSLALKWGKELQDAKYHKEISLAELLDKWGGRCHFQGVVSDIESSLEGAFLSGKITIAIEEGKNAYVYYQNEFLAVEYAGQFIATTPDILVLFDEESFQAIPVERVQYGLKVTICSLLAPAPWLTSAGLELVGPQAFGYPTQYKHH